MTINFIRCVFVLLLVLPMTSYAQVVKCYAKNEVGEMSEGNNYIFERADILNKAKPSVINFDELKIINSDTGQFSDIKNLGDNLFISEGGYYYLTNDEKSIVVEINFDKSLDVDLVYSKILFCKSF